MRAPVSGLDISYEINSLIPRTSTIAQILRNFNRGKPTQSTVGIWISTTGDRFPCAARILAIARKPLRMASLNMFLSKTPAGEYRDG